MSYYVYILQCKDRSLYTGITTNVPQRFAQHQSGTGAKYTRGRGPLQLMYVAKSPNRSTASVEEARIKKLSLPEKKLLLSQGDPQLLLDCIQGREIPEKTPKKPPNAKKSPWGLAYSLSPQSPGSFPPHKRASLTKKPAKKCSRRGE